MHLRMLKNQVRNNSWKTIISFVCIVESSWELVVKMFSVPTFHHGTTRYIFLAYVSDLLCVTFKSSLSSLGSCHKRSPRFPPKCIQCTLLECPRSSVFCTMSAIWTSLQSSSVSWLPPSHAEEEEFWSSWLVATLHFIIESWLLQGKFSLTAHRFSG